MPARSDAPLHPPFGDRAVKCSRLMLALVPAAALVAGRAPAAAAQVAGAAAPQAQHRVTGRVTNAATGGPVEAVTVRVSGTTVGATTDDQGRYRLNAPSPNATLVFTRIGMARQEVAVGGREVVDVVLQPTATSLAGVTVVGYQTVSTEKLTSAVVAVDPAAITATPTNSPIRALQGRVAGLTVTQTGSPGEAATVRIRGITTLGTDATNANARNAPLYVVDGIPTNSDAAQQLKAEDIETLQVLKDAASASIYGSRASNGVIVITTKAGSGSRQPTRITVASNLTTSAYPAKLDVLSTEERGRALWQAAVNDGVDPRTLPIYTYDWTRNPDGTATLNRVIVPAYVGDTALRIRAADTKWFDEISRAGLVQNHTLQASTTGDRGTGLLSLGYFGDRGIVRGTDFNRLNGRINSSFNFFGRRLTVGENLAVTRGAGTPLPSGLGGNPLNLGLIAQPILPVRTETGAYAGPSGAGFDDRDNPVQLIDINSWDRNTALQGLGNLFAQYALTPNLQANARLGVDYRDGDVTDVQRRYAAGFLRRDVNSLRSTVDTRTDWTFNSTLNYGRGFGRHNVTLLGGFEAVSSDFRLAQTYREGFAVESRDYFVENAGTGNQTVSGDRGGYSLASFFGKVDYDYQNRYLATLTLRRDGSSRFGRNNRYGVFPAASLGWRLSKEAFFPAGGPVSDLKLRLGVGRTGNQEIANNAQYALYVSGYGDTPANQRFFNPSNSTAYGVAGQNSGTLPSGFLRTQTGNPDLRWETTTESNAGLDFGLFGDKLTGSVDYFQRTTRDILIRPAFIAVIGNGGDRWANGATMKVRGAELTARYERIAGALTWSVGGNAAAYRDRITQLPPEVVRTYPNNAEQTILGRSVTSIFGYQVQGIFQDAGEVAAAATQPGKAVGRLRYRDLNGDGRIDALDQTWLGVQRPTLEYGLTPSVSYRSLSLNVFFQGVHGRDVYTDVKNQTDFTSNFTGANFGRRVLDAWTPQNRGSTIPALTLANTNDEFRRSSYFVEDGSYLKLREVVLGYAVPKAALPGALGALAGARLYVRGGNLLTVKSANTTLPDPEVAFGGYAIPRTFTVGLDLTY